MPTTIMGIYTNQGFVIAADGRKKDSARDLIISDCAQKIWPIQNGKAMLAYALAGDIGVTPKRSSQVIFDFVEEVRKTVESDLMTREQPTTLNAYAELVAQELNLSLRRRIEECPNAYFSEESVLARPRNSGGGFTFTRVFFYGYHDGYASCATVEFHHIEQRLQEPNVLVAKPPEPGLRAHGSKKVLDLIVAGRFRAYKLPRRDWRQLPLSEAIDIAHDLVRAQMSEEARKIDPEVCNGIGGHIHVATITRKDGFTWVPGRDPRNG